MKNMIKKAGAIAWNLLLVYICYTLCRCIFVIDNWDSFGYLELGHFLRLCKGGLLFDTSAISYTCILYVLLELFPLHWKENAGWQKGMKILFVSVNFVMIAANLIKPLILWMKYVPK